MDRYSARVWWKPWSNHFLGDVYIEINQYRKAVDHHHKAALLFEQYGNWPSATILSRIGCARAKLLNDETDVNPGQLYRYMAAAKATVFEGSIRRYMGQILMNLDEGHKPEAERWLREAIESDSRNGTKFELARDYLSYGEFQKRNGNNQKASESIQDAEEIFVRCGATG